MWSSRLVSILKWSLFIEYFPLLGTNIEFDISEQTVSSTTINVMILWKPWKWDMSRHPYSLHLTRIDFWLDLLKGVLVLGPFYQVWAPLLLTLHNDTKTIFQPLVSCRPDELIWNHLPNLIGDCESQPSNVCYIHKPITCDLIGNSIYNVPIRSYLVRWYELYIYIISKENTLNIDKYYCLPWVFVLLCHSCANL